MRALRKYTGVLAKLHVFALFFFFLFPIATPQFSTVLAQEKVEENILLTSPLEPEAIEGEFIIKFHSDQTLQKIKDGQVPKWAKELGKETSFDTRLSAQRIAHVRVKSPASTGNWENLASALSSDPDIYAVEPNYVYHALATPNDPLRNQLWHLDKVSAPQAWEKSKTRKDVIVAVVDTGTFHRHRDLRNNAYKNKDDTYEKPGDDDKNGFEDDYDGWNFLDNNNYPTAHLNPYAVYTRNPKTDRYSCSSHPTIRRYETHGTHVAGIIAAEKNNKIGVVGVAPNVKIMPLKALGGPCPRANTIAVLNSVIYAANNGADIINLSLGSYGYSQIMYDVFKTLSDKGILFVAAAGNSANDNDAFGHYPSDFDIDGIISVAASDPTDKLAEFSNYGAKSVDIAAPGVEILSTIPKGKDSYPNSDYRTMSGTSMAAPIVAGAAALLLADDPSLSNLDIKEKLLSSVDKLPAFSGKLVSGGRLNIERALRQRTYATSRTNAQNRPIPSQRPRQHSPQRQDDYGGIRVFDSRSNNTSDKIRW